MMSSSGGRAQLAVVFLPDVRLATRREHNLPGTLWLGEFLAAMRYDLSTVSAKAP
jgi:hypothetical protein